jgi:hypothetical protein
VPGLVGSDTDGPHIRIEAVTSQIQLPHEGMPL